MCSQIIQFLFFFVLLFLFLIFFHGSNSILVNFLEPQKGEDQTKKVKGKGNFFLGGGFYSYSNIGMVHFVETFLFCSFFIILQRFSLFNWLILPVLY